MRILPEARGSTGLCLKVGWYLIGSECYCHHNFPPCPQLPFCKHADSPPTGSRSVCSVCPPQLAAAFVFAFQTPLFSPGPISAQTWGRAILEYGGNAEVSSRRVQGPGNASRHCASCPHARNFTISRPFVLERAVCAGSCTCRAIQTGMRRCSLHKRVHHNPHPSTFCTSTCAHTRVLQLYHVHTGQGWQTLLLSL